MKYEDQWKLYILKLMKNVDYFENIDTDILREVFYSLKQEYYEEGDVIFTFGDPGDKIIFVCMGSIDLYIPSPDGDEKGIFIDNLSLGSSFGSYSILSDTVRFFKGVAKQNTVVTLLTKTDLISMRFKYPKQMKVMEKCQKWVEEHGVPKMDFRLYRSRRGIEITKKIFVQACR